MHPGIKTLADSLGIELSDRNINESWAWDGLTLGTKKKCYLPFDQTMDDDEDAFIEVELSDSELLHEIGHWVACVDPEQRLFPEYACIMGIAFPGCIGSTDDGYQDEGVYENATAFNEGLIPQDEQTIQEFVAQMLSAHWGEKLGCVCSWDYGTWTFPNWQDYIAFKEQEASNVLNKHKLWVEAAQRFMLLIS